MPATKCDAMTGFLIHANGPEVTSDFVGSAGFGVPWPTRTRRTKHHAIPEAPTRSSAIPAAREASGREGHPNARSHARPPSGTPE